MEPIAVHVACVRRELLGFGMQPEWRDLPDDIANAVAFFASPGSGWVTAQILTVDSGRMDYIGHG